MGLNEPDGEILSLVAKDENTFFKLGLARPQKTGWNLDNASPLNRSWTGR